MNIAIAPDASTLYTVLTQATAPDDLSALARRFDAVRALARLPRESAWQVSQASQWTLNTRHQYHYKNGADLMVVQALAGQSGPQQRPTPGAAVSGAWTDAASFCRELEAAVEKHTGANSPFGRLAAADLGVEDVRYLGFQWLCTALDFSRQVAAASLALPLKHACVLYANLDDEGGHGDFEKSHYAQMRHTFAQIDIDISDRAEVLAWAVPEVVAHVNAIGAALLDPNPAAALAALYVIEKLTSDDATFAGQLMSLAGVDVQDEAYFSGHVDVDVEHAAQWLDVIAEQVLSEEDRRLVFASAVMLAETQSHAWASAFSGWQHWKATGERRVLPFAQLQAQEHA